MKKEIWKHIIYPKLPLALCEQVLVSNTGKVKSYLSGKENFLKLNEKSMIVVTRYGKRYAVNIKQQVYKLFIGEVKSNEIIVAKNGNNKDVRVENLIKMSKGDFMRYCASKVSPLKKREAGRKSSITNFIPILGQIKLYEKLTESKVSEYEMAKRLGVSRDKIRNFKQGKVIAGKMYQKGQFTETDFKEFRKRYLSEYKEVVKVTFFTSNDEVLMKYLRWKIKATTKPAVRKELQADLRKMEKDGIL